MYGELRIHGRNRLENENKSIEVALKETKSQYERILNGFDLLEKKATSFIGFISIFFSIIVGIILSGSIASNFKVNNIWTLIVILSTVLIFLILSLYFSFIIIFGSTTYMGPNLIRLYQKRTLPKPQLEEKILIEYIDSIYRNSKKTQNRIFAWKLSMSFTLLAIFGLVLLLIDTAIIKNNPQQIFMGFIGPSILIVSEFLIAVKLRKRYIGEINKLDKVYERWEKILEEDGYGR